MKKRKTVLFIAIILALMALAGIAFAAQKAVVGDVKYENTADGASLSLRYTDETGKKFVEVYSLKEAKEGDPKSSIGTVTTDDGKIYNIAAINTIDTDNKEMFQESEKGEITINTKLYEPKEGSANPGDEVLIVVESGHTSEDMVVGEGLKITVPEEGGTASAKKETATDPPKTDPPKTDPPKPEPQKTTPPKTDPPKTDPPKTDPPKTDPPKTDPPKTDPPKTDPPKTDPPATDPPAPKESPKIPTSAEKAEMKDNLFGDRFGEPVAIEEAPSCKHNGGFEYKNEGEQHLVICKQCNKWLYRRNHQSSGGWVYDDAGHWHVCDDCNARFDYHAHTPTVVDGVTKCKCGWTQAVPPSEAEEKQEEQKPSEESVMEVKESPAPVASPKPAATRYTAPPRAKASPKPDTTPDPTCTHKGSIHFHFNKDFHWIECSKCGKRFEVYQAHTFEYSQPKAYKKVGMNLEMWNCTVCGFHYYRNTDTGEWLIRDYGWWDRSADPVIPWVSTPLNEFPDDTDFFDYMDDHQLREDENAQEFFDNLDKLKAEAQRQAEEKQKEEAERLRLSEQARKEFEQRKQEEERSRLLTERLRQKAQEEGVNLKNLSEYARWMEKNYESVSGQVDQEIAEKKAAEEKAAAEKAEQAKQPATESGGQPAPAASPGPGPGPAPEPEPGPGSDPGPGGGDPGPGGGDPGPGGGDPGPGGGDPGPGGGDPGPGGGDPGPGGGDPGPGGGNPGPGGGNPGPGGGNPGPGGGNPGPGGGGGSIGVVISTPVPASTPVPPEVDDHEHIFGLPIKSGEKTHTRWCITCGRVGQSENHRFLYRGDVEPCEKYPDGGKIYQCPLCGYSYVEQPKTEEANP